MYRTFRYLPVVLLLLCARPAAAQEDLVPRIPDAELAFEQGLEAFQEGDYGMAYRRFRLVYQHHGLNRKTTAAMLMAGKALYRDGAYADAVALLSELVEAYPTSSYLDEAERTIAFARQRLDQEAERARVLNLGVALPLRDEDAALTQALFNGIRLAVEEHNQANVDTPVRMLFRDTRDNPERAREMVTELALVEEVDAIVGPLYSREAEAAAAAADQAEVVLLAPLATEESVSRDRNYVFQANPTITMRGRLMARFAVRSLRLRQFGVVAELNDSYSERMAEGFQDEALLLGADVQFFKLLNSARDWTRLPEEFDAEQLATVEALYLPISGNNAAQLIRAAMDGLDRLGVRLRLLGNGEWHNLNAKAQASRYNATYTHDFYVNEPNPAAQDFEQRYRAFAGSAPQGQTVRLAYTGYDVTRYLLTHMTGRDERPLRQVLREAPPYEGLGMRIDFRGGNVNEAMFFLRYRASQLDLLR